MSKIIEHNFGQGHRRHQWPAVKPGLPASLRDDELRFKENLINSLRQELDAKNALILQIQKVINSVIDE